MTSAITPTQVSRQLLRCCGEYRCRRLHVISVAKTTSRMMDGTTVTTSVLSKQTRK